MAHTPHDTPRGHGELLTEPPVSQWAAVAGENARSAADWRFEVGGMDATSFRGLARAEVAAAAEAFSARIGLDVPALDDRRPVVMTGHQPALYHPGVWVKVFLLHRIAGELGATGVDCVVDSDSFDRVALKAPCLEPRISRCEVVLAEGRADGCYALEAPPDRGSVARFCSEGRALLAALPTPAPVRHFTEFCECLNAASPTSTTLAELMTAARRRYEAPAGTDYLELLVSEEGSTEAFRRFVAHIAHDAIRFAEIHNEALASYRRTSGTRSATRPFPDLAVTNARVELPFWHLSGGVRAPVFVSSDGSVSANGQVLAGLGPDLDGTANALQGVKLAPRAVTLTLFNRLFVSDLFIHGVGGSRYDRVTDAIVRAYFGVTPPKFVTASLTMLLPLGGRLVTEADVRAAEQMLKRLDHNPDQLLGEIEFESAEECERAYALAAEKDRLVAAIATPKADRKALGGQIRSVNGQLAEVLGPLRDEFERELERMRAASQASEVLTDRTYPFCLWSPLEVQDKVR